MDLRFNATASAKTDEELLDTIENRQLYLPETIEASVAELQYRGHAFTEEELTVINEDIEAHRRNADMTGGRIGFASNTYKNNIVQDPDAPSFYSRRAVYGFTFFLGALFGSIMLAININKTKNPVNALWVILFGIGFTVMQVVIVQSSHANSSLAIIFGILSASILEYFFWNRFIGNSTFYRLKPIWIPLIIGFAIATLVVLAAIYAPE